MSYSGNMPDWHQYNPPQPGRTTATSHPQNVNSSHHFISSITPPALDGINLSVDRQTKHQRNDVAYQRNYQATGMSANCPTSTSLTTPGGVHMSPLSNCVNHYGSTSARNSIIEPPSLDPRLGLNENEMAHRNNQMSFNPPTNHTNSNLTVNPNLHTGGITSQTSPAAPLSPGRQSYSCKLPCCNPDGNMPYQHWEKYGPYQSNPTYRDNVRTSSYPMENRRFVPELNLRKDCIENKEIPSGFPVDHRRNYDYKYSRKDMTRNYPASGLLPNYPMQNYNFPTDCQKCPHSVKDYMRRGSSSSSMTPQNPGLMKYPEQQIPSKYNAKQITYQNGNHQSTIPNSGAANLSSPLQNSYFNAPISREVPREYSREYQEGSTVSRIQQTASNPAIIHGGYQKYHVYQQKIAMQRFSVENHLRAMARVPGYQSHPKYQEYVMRYRELLRLQQNVDYQNFLQDPSKIPPTSPNAPVPPINLQFDQNGCLINSSYTQGHFSNIHNPANPVSNSDITETSPQAQTSVMNPLDQNHYKHQEQSLNLSRESETHPHMRNDVPPHYQMPENQNENFENMIVDVDSIDPTRTMTSATDTMSTTTAPSADLVNSKEFADKPQLDVRQFLANWDETEEEEGNGNTAEVSSNTTPVIVHNIAEANHNNVDVISSPKEQTEQQNTVEKSPVIDTNIVEHNTVDKVDKGNLKTIEEFANSGTIVQCIQTDSSDIPTIHIVDHLPEASELATISTVYGDVTSLSIEQIAAAPIEIINGNQDAGETISLFGQETGVCSKEPECSNGVEEAAAAVIEEVGSMIETSESTPKSPENVTTTTNIISTTVEPPRESPPQEANEVSEKSQTIETTSHLRKQHSFASEESHNPDDISLPDLPMSECTPISTTLNTPIHSDSEESSGHVADLAISTNPIEIIQNSPIISFTHSPIKIDPYSNIENGRLSEKRPHNSLEFDFSENSKKSSQVENYEIARRSSSNDDNSCEPKTSDKCNDQVPSVNNNQEEKSDKDDEFYPSSDPLVGMSQNSKITSKKNQNELTDSSNDITNVGECSVGSLTGNAVPSTPVSRILSTDEIDTGKCPSIIDTEDFQQTDDLDKLCNISLDSSCMMPLIPEDSQEPRLSSETIDNMKNILPITNLNELESSDDEQLDKDDDWVEVRSMDESQEPNVSVNEMLITLNENPSTVFPLHTKETENMCDDKTEKSKVEDNKKTKHIRSIFDTSEDSQSTGFDEFMKKSKEKDEKHSRDRLSAHREFRRDDVKLPESNENNNEIVSSELLSDDPSRINNSSIVERNSCDEITREIEQITVETNHERDKNSRKNDYPKIETCKVTQSFRRSHKDTDVEIHVANINVEKLYDSASEATDAIEIKINVSRHDKKFRIKSIEKSEDKSESKKIILQKFEKGHYCPEKIFPRRRISNPEEYKKSKKEIRRRHSGGNTYRSYRKSIEEKINDAEIRHRNIPIQKLFNKEETSELSFSEGPISSHDDSQQSATVTETPNTCDSQGTEEESIFEESEISKMESSKRRDSTDSANFGPDFDELENMASRSCQSKLPKPSEIIPGPSTTSQTDDVWDKLNFFVDNTSTMDFDNFDVAPNESNTNVDVPHTEEMTSSTLTEDRALSRRLEECEKYRNPYSKPPYNEALEIDLNTVPIYTTKDGKIKYSPNPKYTYKVLIMEAKQREGNLRDFHHERFVRDKAKRLQKHRHDSPNKDEKRRSWCEYNSMRAKRCSSNRKLDDSCWRSNRCSKYDRWRERPPELESDDPSIESTKSNKSEFHKFLQGCKINERFLDDLMIPNRKSSFSFDEERAEDSLMIGCINNLSVTSHSHDFLRAELPNLTNTKSIEARIFNGDELELFSRKEISEMIAYEESEMNRREILPLRDFGEKKKKEETMLSDEDSKNLKDVMGPMKPPPSVDLEQDSQAMLTDSGLESSTTYTEGSKEPRRCPIWQRGIISDADKILSVEKFEETPIAISGEINLVQNTDNKEDNKRAEERENEGVVEENNDILDIKDGDKFNEEEKVPTIEEETPPKDKELSEKIIETGENSSSKTSEEIEKLKILNITKLTRQFLSKNYSTNFESSVLEGLDLAFPTQQIHKVEKPKIIINAPREDSKNEDDSVSKPSEMFDRQSSSFLCTKKPDIPPRRASSDEVKKREENNISFFANKIKFPESSKNLFSEGIKSLEVIKEKTFDINEIKIRENEESEGKTVSKFGEASSLMTEHNFEKPEVPPVNLFKSFVAPARKINDAESSEISTESEISQLDETLSSTQFGSEYAVSKQDGGSSSGLNFLSTSSQEAVDATDLKGVRKDLALCALDDKSKTNHSMLKNLSKKIEEREKILIFSGRISSESEDDSNAQDGSPIGGNIGDDKESSRNNEDGEKRILNFSGKIRSPEAPSEPHISSPLRIHVSIEEKIHGNSLNFSGKIPSPKNSERFSPKSNDKLELNKNINGDDVKKNLTFSGKIRSDVTCRSPNTFDKIPKFIIKKTDCSSRSSSISQIFPSDISAQRSFDSKASCPHRISLHPKIPKMIIRNVRSRPGTPTIEENAVELSFPKTHESDNEKVFEVKIKLDEQLNTEHEASDTTMRKSIGLIECKVPKMKIKLEDKNSRMIFENASMELSENDSELLKNIPKVRIRKIKKSTPRDEKKITESSLDKSDKSSKVDGLKESSLSINASFQGDDIFSEKYLDKIPKLKIKKQEQRLASLSPDPSKRKRPKSPENSQKKQKKSSSRHRSLESRGDSKSLPLDLETTTNSTLNLSEKIPKVIIKRASSTSEFKCELSKDGGESIITDSKWQPEVKLERFEVLDSIAKEQGRVHLPLELVKTVTRLSDGNEGLRSLRKLKRTSSDPSRREDKSDRSSSRGRRRYSDPEKPSNHCNDDSDSKDLPIIIRRNYSRRIEDDSSQEENFNTRSEFSSVISRIKDDKSVKETSGKTVYSEEVTRSEFEYPNVISSHKKLVEINVEPVVPALTGENANDAIGDTKSSEEQSVIKLESSDESQTTIEMLPASSDISQPESEVPTPLEGERRIANGDMARVYSSDAIPTQFELELEIVDNSSGSLEVPVPGVNTSVLGDKKELWNYHPQIECPSVNRPGPSFIHTNHKDESENVNIEAKSICSTDSLVKDVLAAKETLKKYLATSKHVSNPALRTKTPAEKKQFTGVELPVFSDHKNELKTEKNKKNVFQKGVGTSTDISRTRGSSSSERDRVKREKTSFSRENKDREKKHDHSISISDKRTKDKVSSRDYSSKGLKRSSRESDHSSTKKMRPLSSSTSSRKESSKSVLTSSASDTSNEIRSHAGRTKPHESMAGGKEGKKKTIEIMPILEPEGHVNFEPSSRDTSRSPPVITKQDSSELNPESPKKVEVNVSDKIEGIIEPDSEAMTFADIVAKMAYHEKATIKHRRYCILCERWFPTTARHRRHLSGYQHRHTELTQRRTVHALFMLFTGKPCPRLLPASIVRTDCAPGEPTPLQIAVQDVAISLEKAAIDKAKKMKEENE